MKRELFGGALEMSVPPRFYDISQLRQVPDTQEVFADGNTDQSFIIEILSYTHEVTDDKIAEYMFTDLADANGAQKRTLVHNTILTDQDLPHFTGYFKSWALGEQYVAKYNEEAENQINIFVGVVRVPKYETDILLTLNDPVVINPLSSSASSTAEGENVNNSTQLFKQVFESLNVKDWSIFQT